MDEFVAKVESAIRRERLFARKRRILIGVSGGMDSIVLLQVMAGMAERFGWTLGVVHLNHSLRGHASGADARFVKGVAKSSGWPSFDAKVDVKRIATEKGISIEMAAREARHELFRAAAKEFGCRTIALAHHRDDQVEQFFLRLFRGAGTSGLSGMPFKSNGVIGGNITIARPLLEVSRAEIVAFARANNIRFREDASNQDNSIPRNRIRNNLIPQLEAEHTSALAVLVARAMGLLKGDHEALEWVVNEWGEGRLADGDFDQLPVGLKRRIMVEKLRSHGMEPDLAQVSEILDRGISIEEMDSFIVRPEREADKRDFDPDQTALTVQILSGSRSVEHDGFSASIVRKPHRRQRLARHKDVERFDAEKIGGEIVFRHWQAGDRYRPIGLNGSRKLQDCFTDAGVAKAERHERTVITTVDGRIVWVEGLRIDDRFKVTGETREIMEMRWKRTV